MVILLYHWAKEDQAVAAMRGELTVLNMAGCRIGFHGAETVAAFLKSTRIVVTVYLNDCNLGPRGVEIIAESLMYNRSIECLHVNDNQIRDKGAEALIEALNYNVCIKYINLYRTNIAIDSTAIITSLIRNRNAVMIPAAVRSASLLLISARRNIGNGGDLCALPKEIVKMIAKQVWATRKDPKWIKVFSEPNRRK